MQIGGIGFPRSLTAANNYAVELSKSGESPESLRDLGESPFDMRIRRKASPASQLALYARNLASYSEELDRDEKALAYLEEAEAFYREAKDPANVNETLYRRCRLLRKLDRAAESEQLLRAAATTLLENFEPDEAESLQAAASLLEELSNLDHLEDAKSVAVSVIAKLETPAKEQLKDYLKFLSAAAKVHRTLGETDQANTLLERGIRLGGESSDGVSKAHFGLVVRLCSALLKDGETERAEREFLRVYSRKAMLDSWNTKSCDLVRELCRRSPTFLDLVVEQSQQSLPADLSEELRIASLGLEILQTHGRYEEALSLGKELAKAQDKFENVNPVFRGWTVECVVKSATESGDWETAYRELKVLEELMEQHYSSDSARLYWKHSVRAMILESQEKWDACDEQIVLSWKGVSLYGDFRTKCFIAESIFKYLHRHPERREPLLDRLKTLSVTLERQEDREKLLLGHLHWNAWIFYVQHDFITVERLASKALETRNTLGGEETDKEFDLLLLADTLVRMGRTKESREIITGVRELQRGRTHRGQRVHYWPNRFLGLCELVEGNFAVAEPLLVDSAEKVYQVRGMSIFDRQDRVMCIQEIITLYERWHEQEPSEETQRKLQKWQAKLKDFPDLNYISTELAATPVNGAEQSE